MKTHREIAELMDLFHSEERAPGMLFWHPQGWALFRKVQEHIRNVYLAAEFEEVSTPLWMKQSLWQTSGHLDMFAEHMFVGGGVGATVEYALKPMSCPGHILLYKRGVRSYRSLPLRYFEFGSVHRNEASGALNGCLRLRHFTQDDAHVFCTWEQSLDEIAAFLTRAKSTYSAYGYRHIEFKISTRPERAYGDPEDWLRAEAILRKACEAADLEFDLQVGEGAFYGPKIEIALLDLRGRRWQCGTIQLDFCLPERFDLSYINADQCYLRPVILHQAMYGSLERWIGILLETYQGLPAWIHPRPVSIIVVTQDAVDYALEIQQHLQIAGVAAQLESGEESLSRKIKACHAKRVPYVFLVGEREKQLRRVTLRARNDGADIALNWHGLSDWVERELRAVPERLDG